VTTLSYAQAYQLATSVGLGHSAAVTATAIAAAESGLRTDATGDVALEDRTWGPSLGLWQIRSLKAQSGTGQSRDATKLKDPTFNARAMASISSGGTNFSPWSTYNSGAYRTHLAKAQAAAGGSAPPAGTSTASATSSSVAPRTSSEPGSSVQDVSWWDPRTWAKKAWGVTGGKVLGNVGQAVLTGLIWAAALGLGVVLVLIGAWRASQGRAS
jgi:hypothetical protein